MTDDNKPTYVDFMRGAVTGSTGTGPQAGDHTTGNGMLCLLFVVAEYILFKFLLFSTILSPRETHI